MSRLLLVVVSTVVSLIVGEAKDAVIKWRFLDPKPAISLCPYSKIPYDCEHYQQNVWNSPLPVFAPSADAKGSSSDAAAPSQSQESRRRSPSASGEDESKSHPLLFVFLPGTGSNVRDSYLQGVPSAVAELNRFYVIGLNYVSTPFSVSEANNLCQNVGTNQKLDMPEGAPLLMNHHAAMDDQSHSGGCIDMLHQSVVFGSRASNIWNVPPAYSIHNRLLSTLKLLNAQYPTDGWDQFFSIGNDYDGNGTNKISSVSVNYERVIVGGHSQGAGHAAYLGYKMNVNRLLLFSGIQDCCGKGMVYDA
jgi:hypothetical protein